MPASRRKARHELRDTQAVGGARDLGSAGDDLRRIADRFDFNDVVDVVALNLPGNAGERDEIVGDDDDVVGVDGVGERKAERAASRLAVGAVGVAEGVGGRGGDDGNVDVDFAILNGLPAAAMRTQHAHAAHLSLGAVVA